MSSHSDYPISPPFDQELVDIAHYVTHYQIASPETYASARYCLRDALGCGFLALGFPACTRHLGPIVPGTMVPLGARVPGTSFVLDPVKAAFDIGTLVRWLDFNDTWLAAEWGHPSDNLGGILAVSDFLSRRQAAQGQPGLTIRQVLIALIKAYEIQGVLALANSFNRIGLDHVILVKVASTAVAAHLLGATEEQIQAAVSQAWVDGHSLRTYRQAPNTTSRKSWAAGDATSRAVRLALMTLQGEPGLPRALSAPKWGFNEVVYKGQRLQFVRPFGNYVMDNILFKISFPAEFHAQTAVEGALQLHDQVKDRLDQIERIELWTQEPALRIISKTGPLHNPADRDHCLQYMVAVPLIYGYLTADCYEDGFSGDPRLDDLRARMTVAEESQFTRDYYDPEMRAIGNSIQVFFKDGTSTKKVTIAYPLGHPRRRPEGLPLLERKFQNALAACFAPDQAEKISRLFQEPRKLETTPVHEFMDLLVLGGT